MNRSEIQFQLLQAFAVLQQRLRELGLLLVCCTSDGELRARPAPGSDWLADLLCDSPLFLRALRDAAAHWNGAAVHRTGPPNRGLDDVRDGWVVGATASTINHQPSTNNPLSSSAMGCPAPRSAAGAAARGDAAFGEHLALLEPIPGCVLAAMPITERRRRCGYTVTVILSERFLASEQLPAMCQSARMDVQLCSAMLRRLPLTGEADAGRLAAMVRLIHADQIRLASDSVAMESVGQQLAESYEEINLLYTIIGSMTVVERPERFVRMACEELLATLPFAWVGAQFCDEDGEHRSSDLHLKKLAGQLIVVGAPAHPMPALRAAARRLLESATDNKPMVIEPGRLAAHVPFAPLGVTAAVQPVCRGDAVIGVLIAGDRHGPDPAISSADMKILSATATHMSIFLENSALYDDLNAMFLGTLEALTASIDAKDRYTCGHSMRVAWLSRQLAAAVGMEERVVERVHIAGLVHDVGKIGVPEAVLCKPGRLTEDEFAWIRQHPEIGYRILKDIPQLRDVLPGVLHHHERWDGRGYPHGLGADDIPQFARVIALADSFDAMSSNRHYRSALSRAQVLAEIGRCSGSQFDPDLADVFLGLDFSEYDRLVTQHAEKEALIDDWRGGWVGAPQSRSEGDWGPLDGARASTIHHRPSTNNPLMDPQRGKAA